MKQLLILSLTLCASIACGIGPQGGEDASPRFCNDCCFDPETDCRSSEVCRYQLNEENANPGECVGADGIEYTLLIGPVELCEFDPNGDGWDAGAGAPDVILQIVVNGEEVTRSSQVSDRFTAFVSPFESSLELRSTDSITLTVFDSDLAEDDFGGGFCLGGCDEPIGVATLRRIDTTLTSNCAPGGVKSMTVLLLPKLN